MFLFDVFDLCELEMLNVVHNPPFPNIAAIARYMTKFLNFQLFFAIVCARRETVILSYTCLLSPIQQIYFQIRELVFCRQ